MGGRIVDNPNAPTRKIFCLRVVERGGNNGRKTIAEYPFPEVPIDQTIYDRQELERAINRLPLKDHEKLASTNRIGFVLDMWHPNNFYEIGMMDWKY